MSHLDDIEETLQTTGQGVERPRRPIPYHTNTTAPHDWGTQPPPPMKPTYSTKTARSFFLGAFIFAVIAFLVLVLSMQTFQRSVNTDKVDLTIVGNSFVDSGKESVYQDVMLNKNAAYLQ